LKPPPHEPSTLSTAVRERAQRDLSARSPGLIPTPTGT